MPVSGNNRNKKSRFDFGRVWAMGSRSDRENFVEKWLERSQVLPGAVLAKSRERSRRLSPLHGMPE